MADNRQFADHVELGGANVYFKEEPTTGTTMPSTSYFKTEDVDGKPVKISRDSIMGIVKECLGTILNGGSDQTTVTKVPTLNGNTLGASAIGTLASVLGGNPLFGYKGESIYDTATGWAFNQGDYTIQYIVSSGRGIRIRVITSGLSASYISIKVRNENGDWGSDKYIKLSDSM